jgi:hypothetical protein
LDVGRKHREKNEKQFATKVKEMEIKLREEMECKFEDLKRRMKGASLLQAATIEGTIESISQTIS